MPYGKRSVHLVFTEGEWTYYAFVHDSKHKLNSNLLIDSRYLNPMGYPLMRGHRVVCVVQLVVWKDECAVATPASLLESPVVLDQGMSFYSVSPDLYRVHSLANTAEQLFRMEEFDAK